MIQLIKKGIHMKLNSFPKFLSAIVTILSLTTFFISCDTTQNTNGNFSLSFGSTNSLLKTTSDSLQLTEVKILLKDVKLEQESADKVTGGDHHGEGDEVVVRVGPFVVQLNLTGLTTDFITSEIPAGMYDEIRFKIHKLEGSEIPPDPEFIDSQDTTKRYSVIVKGNYNGTPFVYRSSKSAHQKLRLDEPLVVEENTSTNLTITVDPYTWFYEHGTLLDPTDANNMDEIDHNISASFRNAFRDNNHDCNGD